MVKSVSAWLDDGSLRMIFTGSLSAACRLRRKSRQSPQPLQDADGPLDPAAARRSGVEIGFRDDAGGEVACQDDEGSLDPPAARRSRESGGEKLRKLKRKSVSLELLAQTQERLRMSLADCESTKYPSQRNFSRRQLPDAALKLWPKHGKLSLEAAWENKQRLDMALEETQFWKGEAEKYEKHAHCR